MVAVGTLNQLSEGERMIPKRKGLRWRNRSMLQSQQGWEQEGAEGHDQEGVLEEVAWVLSPRTEWKLTVWESAQCNCRQGNSVAQT